jgi:hypothetical protein
MRQILRLGDSISMADRELFRVVGVIFTLWAILLFWMIPEYVRVPKAVDSPLLNPRFWPFTLACLTALVSLYSISQSFVLPNSGAPWCLKPRETVILVAIFCVLAPIPYLLEEAGFVTVLAFVALILNYLKEKRWRLGLFVWISALSYVIAEFFSGFLGVLAEKWPS